MLILINDIFCIAIAVAAFAFVIYLTIDLVGTIISQRGMAKYLKSLENKVLKDIDDDVKNDDKNS